MSDNTSNMTFSQMLRASFKSEDTEEWLDVHFTRPIGLVFALFWNRLGVHPNAITVLSFFFGAAAGLMFYFTDLCHNLMGVAFLMLANFCDSTDGQMARLTGKKTLLGRILDGFSADVWFVCIYAALALRLMPQTIPFTGLQWGLAAWVLVYLAGIHGHTPQCAIADYYRQIHLLFVNGKDGSELDTYESQMAFYKTLPKDKWLERLFFYNYAKYCGRQERRTPCFQEMSRVLTRRYGSLESLPAHLREEFLAGSRPLMKWTNILTFNTRAICLYIACLIDQAWIYPLFEIVVLTLISQYMHARHERLCRQIILKAQ